MGFRLTPRAAHPGRALFPRLAGALSPALQREGVRLAGGGKDRGCRAAGGPAPPPLPPAPGLRTEGRAWAQGRWETQRLHRARSPRHDRRARQILTPWGGAQPPCKRRPQLACHSPTACQPSSCGPCHPRGLGLVQVPRAAPVTLCVSVPRQAGLVDLLPLLLPLGIVPAHLQGAPRCPAGSWAWDQGWTPGLPDTLQGEDIKHHGVEAETALGLGWGSRESANPFLSEGFDVPTPKLDPFHVG